MACKLADSKIVICSLQFPWCVYRTFFSVDRTKFRKETDLVGHHLSTEVNNGEALPKRINSEFQRWQKANYCVDLFLRRIALRLGLRVFISRDWSDISLSLSPHTYPDLRQRLHSSAAVKHVLHSAY